MYIWRLICLRHIYFMQTNLSIDFLCKKNLSTDSHALEYVFINVLDYGIR